MDEFIDTTSLGIIFLLDPLPHMLFKREKERRHKWRFFFVKKGIGKHGYTGINTSLWDD